MIKRMSDKQKKIVIIVLAVCLLLGGICVALYVRNAKKKATEPVLLETLVQESYFFSEQVELTQEALFDSGITELRMVYGNIGGEVYETTEKVCYVGKEDRIINRTMPVYQKNGATMFFPETMPSYRLLCTDYTVVDGIGAGWLVNGSIFNTDNQQAIKKSIFFADLGNGVLVNALPITVEGAGSYTVPANSLLHFYEDNLGIFAFSDGVLNRYYIPVTGQSMVRAEGVRISYHKLFEFCTNAVISDEPLVSNNGILLEGNYFYYDLGERFEIKGPGFLYETKDGWFFENEMDAYLLPKAPLYAEGEESIYLPTDYMMLQTVYRLYNCLPATTKIKRMDDVAMVSYKDVFQTYYELLLHDGKEHYIVTEEALFRLKDKEILISPMSSIYITDDVEICFYQYDSEEYFTFNTEGKEPELVLSNGDVVYLYKRLIQRKDGTLDLLLNDPTVFPVVQ